MIKKSNIASKDNHLYYNWFITTLIFMFVLSVPAIAQDKSITLSVQNGTLKSVFSQIEKQTPYRFSYRDADIDTKADVSIQVKNGTINGVLTQILQPKNLHFSISSNKVMITPTQTKKQGERKKVSGVIVDDKGIPVIGANVVEKGTTNGTVTDIDGQFALEIAAGNPLLVSYIGYQSSEIPSKDKQSFRIELKEDSEMLEEVVVVGYGTQKKASLTGSISTVKIDEEKKSISSSNLSSVLAGTMSGLRINNRTGMPGVSSDLAIRNSGSWGGASPVYVVDGVVSKKADFDRLDGNEVENITVLKDAASAAIYGSRASGGVVLITTKQGREGKPRITYSGSYAIEARGMEMERTSGIEMAELANYMHRNNPDHWTTWDEAELESIRNINGGWGYDVVDEYWNAPSSTHHSLGLTGGNERVKYFINGSYFGQEAFLRGIDYSRFNIRANLEAAVNKNLKVVVQLSSSYGTKNNIAYGTSENDLSGIYSHMRCIQPEMKSRTSDGKPVDWGWIGNIGEFSNKENSGYNKGDDQITQTLIRAEYTVPFVEGLKAKVQFAYDYQNNYNKTFLKKQQLYQVKREGRNGHIWTDEIIGTAQSAEPSKESLSQTSNRDKGYQLNFQLDYARTFGKHDLSALLVYEQKEGWTRNFKGGRENFPVLIKDQWFATSSARSDSWVEGEEKENGRLSYIGQVNYGFDNKYLINASLRVDGSMNFPEGKQYGYFPAASGAWVISKENFFRSSTIDMLKMRASVGLTGNDGVIGWQWQESYKNGTSAFLGTTPSTNPGIQFGGVVNPYITWEKSLSYNIGADLYWKSHFTASMDYWFRNTYDILGERIQSLPTSFGFKMPLENYGKVHASGIDLELGYRNSVRDFNYYVKGVFSYATNKIKVQDYAQDAPHYKNPIGRPDKFVVGYRDAGIIRTQADLDALNAHYKQQFGENHEYTVFGYKAEKGMLVYQDLGGPNGKPDGKIDSYDQDVLCKYSTPPFSAGLTVGFEWRGFTFETLFQGDFGYQRYLDGRYLNVSEWNRMPAKWLDHWSEENPNGYFPDPKSNDSFKSYNAVSTFTLHDASFVKMRYLNVGYSFPKKILGSVGFIESARVYFSATNLLTFSGFDFWDPELPSTGSYPNMKTFNFGVDLTF